MTTCSAPGKIILFGEHAVVYGRPALAAPVTQVQAAVTISAAPAQGIHILAPDIGLEVEVSDLSQDHPLAAAINGVLSHLGISTPPPITIQVSSTIPVASGLGSGAAVSVAVIRALSGFLGLPLSDEQVSALAFEVEKLHHGTPSGIDNTVITYEKPVYFVKGQPVKILQPGAPFTLVIGDTGIAAPTKESVGDVRRLWEADTARMERIFDEIGALAGEAKECLVSGKWQALGKLMDANHALLRDLTVSCAELERLVETARLSGALGAKLSGGGRGGNMLALVEKENAPVVAEALRKVGAKRTIITRVG
jgi:mevalonate kinase